MLQKRKITFQLFLVKSVVFKVKFNLRNRFTNRLLKVLRKVEIIGYFIVDVVKIC